MMRTNLAAVAVALAGGIALAPAAAAAPADIDPAAVAADFAAVEADFTFTTHTVVGTIEGAGGD